MARLFAAIALVLSSFNCGGAWAQSGAQSSDQLLGDLEALKAVVEAQARRIQALEAAAENESERLEATAPAEPIDTAGPSPDRIGRFPDDAIVITGDFPGSIRIPGRDGSIRIGGFIRADIIHDTDSLGFEDLVVNRTIPLDGDAGAGDGQTRLTARLSRVNFDFRRQTRLGAFRTFIEADFFGGGDEFNSNYEFRLRHAAAQLGDIYVGQWWSSFTDVASFPESADFAGPMGNIAIRQPGIRWMSDVGNGWRLGAAVENPAGDLSGPEISLASDSVPDLIGYAQLTRNWGRIKIAGLGRRLETEEASAWVGGVNVSGRIPLKFIGDRDNITFQAQTGEGITRYFAGFAGAGLDGSVNGQGAIDPTGVLSGYLAYQHWWSDTLRSTAMAGAMDLDLGSEAAPESFDNGEYYSANLFWTPVNGATLGIDLIYATQETRSGRKGDGLRFQGSARFDF